jgi:urease accessory protein
MTATKISTLRDVETESHPGPVQPARLKASLQLKFQQNPTATQTVLTSSIQEPPLRVVRAFPIADGAAMTHLHNLSGGVLGGDSLALSVHVGVGATVQLTTTGATRIYRARENAAVATQHNQIHIEQNALLEYVPDPIIPFAGSRFSQHTSIALSSGAGLFWWEILAPGREACGEIFQYESLEIKMDISSAGRPMAIERIRLEPQMYDLSSPARFGAYRYYATFYICREGLATKSWLEAEQQLRATTAELSRPREILWGISTLASQGLVFRCLALHGRDVLTGLHSIWQASKILLYGRNAVPPRKVN